MAIRYAFTVAGNTLLVRASGFDESLHEVQEYGLAIIAACLQNNCTRILCDETLLEYRLNTLDTYQAAVFIAERAPKIAKAAIVCNAAGLRDAEFWENVVVNRGLRVRMFLCIVEAVHWLDE